MSFSNDTSSSSSSSDSENEVESPIPRLGNCEVCAAESAKYTCPKCEVKTCSLKCVVIHKKELECDGIRDRTKFVRIKDFTDTDLLSDYRLLEECARFVYGVKKDEKKRFTRIDKDLPVHLFKLKMQARKRGTVLQFLAQNFTRHKVNTTRYQYKTNTILWRVEWLFPNAETKLVKFIDEKCPENVPISKFLEKYLSPDFPLESKQLDYYKSAGFSGVKVLLKAEKVKGSGRKYFELDTKESLAENLCGKCVVEFPIIVVVLKDHAFNFDIVTPEDEFEYDKEEEAKEKINRNNDSKTQNGDQINQNGGQINQNRDDSNDTSKKRPRQLLTEKIANEKKLEIEKEIKEAKKRRPKNLLFTTGYSSEESLSDLNDELMYQ